MTRRILYGAVAVGLGVAALSGGRRAMTRSSVERAGVPVAGAPMLPSMPEREILSRDIAFYTSRTEADPRSAGDLRALATLYQRRARATGSTDDMSRAEVLARRSIEEREGRNGEAFTLLATTLVARHAFTEARDVAARALALAPHDPRHRALLAEIELELGQYDAAARHFATIPYDPSQFTMAARLARWHELTGRADSARRILRESVVRVARRDDLPREQVAWFHFRLGELEARAGRLDSAERAYRRGLAEHPEDYRILGGLARLALARGEWEAALDAGGRAIAVQLDPSALGVMSEASFALGDSAQGRAYARAMAVAALRQPGPIHRAWGLHLLDHGTPADAQRVLAKARRELRTRKDVYGWDLLAWAQHRTGDNMAARASMQEALAQGTEDALLRAHASAIATAAVGHTHAAR